MERMFSESSPYLPGYEFNPDGKLVLEGRSIPENASKFYDKLIDFAGDLETEYVIFDINLDYFNTASSKKILDLLKKLDNNQLIERIQVNWHYEEGDDSSMETAEIYEDCLKRVEFKYHEYAETAD